MNKAFLSVITASTLLFSACSTDLDVIGDYKETMIVYGLLDQAQDIQYVKINKAFLGEGDAYMYAQVKDSVQFANALNVQLRRIKNGSPFGPVIPLNPTNMPKDAGIFYSADQANAIYSFSTVAYPLFADSEYELTITNSETGNVVTAKTSLVSDISGFTNPALGSSFSFVAFGSVPNYPFNVVFNAAKNARLYQVILRLNYVDSLSTGALDTNSIQYILPIRKVTDINTAELVEERMRGKDFYQYIGNNLPVFAGLEQRKALKVDLLLVAGSNELNIFMDVNKPSTGIIQERPEYTNINNGLGLFSSRLNRPADSRPLDKTSTDSLACGQYTKHLKFVNGVGLHPCF
ncbi:MAG: DUF4249 family protein [Bacteroidetes bacterium]|nr:DUF4249 family protein [Bacteroidota bacterium]